MVTNLEQNRKQTAQGRYHTEWKSIVLLQKERFVYKVQVP